MVHRESTEKKKKKRTHWNLQFENPGKVLGMTRHSEIFTICVS